MKSFLRASAIGALALTGTMASAELDLAGETVEWIIPFSETGGSARWANFYAPLLSEALPGNPTVVVTFMPGAGSTTGANHFQGLNYTVRLFWLHTVPLPAWRSTRALRV